MLALYNKDFTTKYGTINSIIEAFVEEERNGLFELSFVMLNTDSLFKYIEEDNIIVANANNTLINQKFRIYMTRKLMNNRVEVFARHISFDLMYDYIDNISFKNQSCEYALNQLFRSSNFSSHYKGYSDIINAQNYNMSMANVLEAIGGKRGSILDTFGTGAELLRDNENIHVLNKRGHDNSVTIEYKKNLTGFELEEDTTDLVTRILPYAKYTPTDEEGNSQDEVVVKASFVDSPLIANYSHPFVKAIDYSDRFEEGEKVTTSKLISFAQNEYKVNKVDIPKQNFKIEFIPLSKCVGYEGLEDNISLCDTVTIKDTRYNIDTQAKVIKTTFNVLKNRYESMELGEPKTSLGDIVGSGESNKGEQGPPGPQGPQGPPGADGSVGDFPNDLPSTPVVSTMVYGFANIEISWTFENKVYYQYEVYASKEANFTPNTFNLIHKGQTSTYMYQAKPNETWYFKVCAINTHENRTGFGYAYATTTKIDDLSNYVDEMAINDALIGTLSLDRGWVGVLKGNYIDAKQLSVTDGNGKRTLDIDSFGNIHIDATTINAKAGNLVEGISQVEQTANKINWIVKDGTSGSNMTLTSNMIQAVSKNIDLTGKVTFNSFSQDVSKAINDTSVKVQEWSGGTTTINGSYITTGVISDKDKKISIDLNAGKINVKQDSFAITVGNKPSTIATTEDIKNKVDSDSIISSINLTPEEIQIQAEKIDMTGKLDLNGTFTCYGSRENQSGNYLYQADAIHRGYIAGRQNPTFSSGIWRPDGVNDVGYVSVGLTNSDRVDENGCLWMSPDSTGGTHLYYSKLYNSRNVFSGFRFDTDGKVYYQSFLPNKTVNNYYSHIFDGGISTHSIYGSSLTCGAIGCTGSGTFNGSLTVDNYTYLNSNLRVNNQIYTLDSNLWLGAGGLNARYMLTLQSDGYLLPKGAVQLGASSNPFYQLVCTYAPSIVSDARKKENISYIANNVDDIILGIEKDQQCTDITTKDMYEYVKEVPLAIYDLKEVKTSGKKQIGFLAQDIMHSKVGKYIVDDRDVDNLSYDLANRISVLEGALQVAINKIEELESLIK